MLLHVIESIHRPPTVPAEAADSSPVVPVPLALSFAKIPADFEINNLAAALPPLFCYNS